MKVIISAYACQPNMGSEEGVAWNWVHQIAKRGHEVYVVTRIESKQAIEAELKHNSNSAIAISFYYLDTPAILRFWKFWGWLYYGWQIGLAFKARQLHRQIGFDLAHHITFATDWMPSGLAILNIPFIWGPVGGSTHQLPPQLELNLSPKAKRAELKRKILQWGFKTFDPLLHLTMKRAAIILPYTQEAVAGIPNKYRDKATPMIHIGADTTELSFVNSDCTKALAPHRPKGLPMGRVARSIASSSNEVSGDIKDVRRHRQSSTSKGRELRIFTGGRLVHWKGFDLLLEGLSLHLQATGANTKIVCTCIWSEGRGYFSNLAKSFGVESHIELLGRLPQKSDVLSKMRDCDLYALPTWRDGPPTGILEAMVQGLPILCLNMGATSELVPDGAGFKIPAYSHQQIVWDIAAAITQASKDRLALKEMGKVGQQHALNLYDWDKIGDRIEETYQRVMSNK